jgi:small subunit ribosomal protein S1
VGKERQGDLTQEEQIDLKPWEMPLEEEYWLALLQQGEHATDIGSLPDQDLSEQEIDEQGASEENQLDGDKDSSLEIPDTVTPSWELAETYLREGMVLTVPAVGYNRGGILIDWNGWQGFVPASQLTTLPPHLTEEERKDKLAACVGEQLALKIIELDRDRQRLIFSEKAVLSQEDQIEQLMGNICRGDILQGYVTNLCSFGAFVDVGGLEGLIHISELSWGRVAHSSDVLDVGQEIQVYVINVDRSQKRIGLSLKRLQPDPWSSLRDRYEEGQLVQGIITNVVGFGAFARIEQGVEGLIHVSELTEEDFVHPRNVVKEGDTVTVRIVNIDSVNHRLGLSLRQVDLEGDSEIF